MKRLAVLLVAGAVVAMMVSTLPASAASGNCWNNHPTRYVAQADLSGGSIKGIQHRIGKGSVNWYGHSQTQWSGLAAFGISNEVGFGPWPAGHPSGIFQMQAGIARGRIRHGGGPSTSTPRPYVENWDINSLYNAGIYHSLAVSNSNFFNVYNSQVASGAYRLYNSYFDNYSGSGITLIGQSWFLDTATNRALAQWEADAFNPSNSKCPKITSEVRFGQSSSGSNSNSTRLYLSSNGLSWSLWTSGNFGTPTWTTNSPYSRDQDHWNGAFDAEGGD